MKPRGHSEVASRCFGQWIHSTGTLTGHDDKAEPVFHLCLTCQVVQKAWRIVPRASSSSHHPFPGTGIKASLHPRAMSSDFPGRPYTPQGLQTYHLADLKLRRVR